MNPFCPSPVGTKKITVGVASANIAVTAGRQAVLSSPISNTDIIHVEFGATNVIAAVIPVAGGAQGGTPILPGGQIEISVPSGQFGIIGNFLAYISGTAAQTLLYTEGGDV